MRWVLLILLGFARFGAADAQVPPNRDTLNSFGINGMDSSGKVANYWYYFPENRFVDSLRIDSIADRFAVGLYLQFPTEKAYRERDKFDPFLHEIYFRKARAQTWFFVVSLLVIFYLIYYRSVYQRQFELRVTGLYKPYFFEDLMREQQISSAAGSVHAFAIGLLVFSLGVMLYLINLDFNKLNIFLMFLLVLIAWSGLSFFLYVLQRLFAFSMKIEDLLSRNFQRQIRCESVSCLADAAPIPDCLLQRYRRARPMGIPQYVLCANCLDFIAIVGAVFWYCSRRYVESDFIFVFLHS